MVNVTFADWWGPQLLHGIISWDFLQFVVAFLTTFGFVLTSATILVLAERKVMGWMQDRLGPMHTGPWGMLQTVADVAKLLLKEDIKVSNSDKVLFLLAPSVFLAPVIASFAVIPFSPYINLPGTALATGIIYYVAMSSIDVVGVIMAGWSSNNKYALIGGLRSAAQMISYELPLVLSLVGIVMLTSALAGHDGYPGLNGIGTISLRGIMDFQNTWHKTGIGVLDFIFEGFTPWAWFFLVQPLMLIIYYTCGLAETNRAPFDLPEAESELIAGYHTEYSAMKFSLFFIAEYASMVTQSALMATLFFGGWDVPFTARDNIGPYSGWLSLLSIGIFLAKILFFLFLFMWVRWTLPRFRYDQLMSLGWKVMLPLALVYIVLIAGVMLGLSASGIPEGAWWTAILGSVNVAVIIILFAILDRGRIISPAYGRMQPKEIERLRRLDRNRPVAAEAGR
ncbi:MAG TPA: NADH-quinone oxidoreductase subunit H [Ktedonobacteraceae bacterium]